MIPALGRGPGVRTPTPLNPTTTPVANDAGKLLLSEAPLSIFAGALLARPDAQVNEKLSHCSHRDLVRWIATMNANMRVIVVVRWQVRILPVIALLDELHKECVILLPRVSL